jgi:hypothetical protein
LWEDYFWGRKNYFGRIGLHFWVTYFSSVGSLVLGGFWGTIAGGTRLLGVLGTRDRISYSILELGSRTGCS